MEITGTIHKIYKVEEKNGYKSQFFTLIEKHKDNPKYDKFPCFICKTEKTIEALSHYKSGDRVTIKYDMNSKEWNEKPSFLENNVWGLAGHPSNQKPTNYNQPSAPQATSDDSDLLPF